MSLADSGLPASLSGATHQLGSFGDLNVSSLVENVNSGYGAQYEGYDRPLAQAKGSAKTVSFFGCNVIESYWRVL